jgi:hypothetical protein
MSCLPLSGPRADRLDPQLGRPSVKLDLGRGQYGGNVRSLGPSRGVACLGLKWRFSSVGSSSRALGHFPKLMVASSSLVARFTKGLETSRVLGGNGG